MNNHGINSAALNGSAVRMIAGAALLAVVMTASANPTRTQFATAQPVLSAKVVANALRVANARARVTITSDGSAQWVIATSAAVSIAVTSTARATYTAAWSAARMSAKVAGFITRPGEAMARSAISLTADPTVTLGYSSDIRVTSWASADPSVQRLGEPTWSRDGYARIESAVTVTATADRTALAIALARFGLNAEVDALKTHGGGADITVQSDMSALGSTDFALVVVSSTMHADPTVTRFGHAAADYAFDVTAEPTNEQSGQVDPVSFAFAISADARLALQAGAHVDVGSAGTAEGRLGLLSGSQVEVITDGYAGGTITRPGAADVDVVITGSAHWQILKFGGANIDMHIGVRADPVTNPTVPAPINRTAFVPADAREMAVPGQFRLMEVA